MNKKEDYNIKLEELINKRQNSIKEFTIILNNNEPIFTKKDYATIEGEPIYFDAINKIVQKILVKKQSNKNNNQNTNYVINRKTNKFHLKDNGCNSFKNVESKYINETTATEKDLIKAGLTACEKCKKIKYF